MIHLFCCVCEVTVAHRKMPLLSHTLSSEHVQRLSVCNHVIVACKMNTAIIEMIRCGLNDQDTRRNNMVRIILLEIHNYNLI